MLAPAAGYWLVGSARVLRLRGAGRWLVAAVKCGGQNLRAGFGASWRQAGCEPATPTSVVPVRVGCTLLGDVT